MRALPAVLLVLLAASVAAQPAAPGAEGGLTIRLSAGAAALSLGDAETFHQSVADTYVSAGVAVPTQRAFPAGPSAGVDVLWDSGRALSFGAGVRYAGASAYSLYGDYAGTLDIVSRVSAVFVESVSVAEFGAGRRVRPFVGSRGGTVYASTQFEEAVDLRERGAAASGFDVQGLGFSVEGFGGLASSVGPVGLFVQGGYRYARVGKLTGDALANGEPVYEVQLPFGLDLSGWTGTVGLTLRP